MIRHAYLEVIVGPMYSGKTEELIRRAQRAVLGKKKVVVFKHAIDTRYGKDAKIYSHSGMAFSSVIIQKAAEILKQVNSHIDIVAIDEAQWLGEELIPVVEKLLKSRKYIIIAGLGLTYDRQPFVPMPTLMAMADKVTKLTAICSMCGAEAIFHKRLTKDHGENSLSVLKTLVAEKDMYEARCRNCFTKK